MQKNKGARRSIAWLSSLLLLLTMLTPFSALADSNTDGYEEVLRFSAFEKTFTSGQIGDNIYADWTKGDQTPKDVTDGHKMKNLRLQLKFTLTQPEGNKEMSTTWNKLGYLKLRSSDDPGENNYGWMVSSKSGSPMRMHTGENELLIPLLDTASNDYELTRTGTMDWTKVDRILFVLSGKDMKKGVADHSMTVTYAAIVDVGEQPDPVETVSMPTLFANKMMFQQNQPMKLWGSGNAGESVEVALYKQGETAALQTKTATVDADGSWSLELDGRAASYQKYNIAVSMKDAAGKVTKSRTLSDVLIGEVWVAAGQSNMALPVSNDLYADEYAAAADNDNIRLFLEPTYPTGEKTEQPLEPATDIPGAYWGTGADDGDVMAVSSVGYHFAVAMQKKLDVPFGLLYTPVGGSVIEAWIPRDAIDKDAEYKAFLKSRNKYCDENNWPAQGNRMSALYNQKIGALTGYHVAGTIWYQGESNQDEPDMYGHALTLMRDAWNEVFGYTTGTNDMPFVFTTVQPWITHLEDPQYLAYLAEGMYDGWKANEQRNMSMITLYDLPLYFLDRNGNSSDPIHPRDKTPVGERFATAAFNMVYNDTATEYTAPVYQSHKAVDLDGDGINDAIDVTFDHVGDGLQVINTAYTGAFGVSHDDGLGVISETDDLHGFAIAGTGGVYVDAKAKITGKNTVRVWSNGLKNPANVTYNFYTYYTGGNLKNSSDIPAVPFRTDRSATASYFNAQDWRYADANVWTCFPKEVNGSTLNWADFLDSWVSGAISGVKADWSYDKDVKAEGRASVKVTYTPDDSGVVGIGPVMGRLNVTNQFDNFDTIAVAVKNADAREKQLSLLLRASGKTYTAALVNNFEATDKTTATVPASGDFATYTFSLRHLTDENGKLLTDTDALLQNIEQLQFTFADNKAGTVYVDDVQFGFLYDANVDKTALQREMNWGVNEALYTAASLDAYKAALEQAEAVANDPVATQSQVTRMAKTLKEARLSLVETHVVTTFSAFEKTYAVGDRGMQNLYADWTQSDISPLDLTQYDMSQLRLQIKFTLTKPDDIEETADLFNHYGFIKLRSLDTPSENNYGWQFTTAANNPIKLHSGENELSIPLVNQSGDGYTVLRTGNMDWSQVNRIIMMISNDVMKGRDGEFSLEITDAKIVNLAEAAPYRTNLKNLIDQSVDTTGDEQAVAAYTRAKASAQTVYDDEMASLTAIEAAASTLKTAIDVLNGKSFTAADKSALQALVNTTVEQNKYTAASYRVYAKALAAAKAVLDNDYASKAVVDDALDTLQQAVAGLLEAQPVDTTELTALVNEDLDLTPYTDASANNYREALSAGRAVLEGTPSQAQVDNAIKAIKAAKEALKEKQNGDPTDIRVTFSGTNNTYDKLLYGWQFYTDWKVGDGLSASTTTGGGANLSGTAVNGANRNLSLQVDVTFKALKDGVDLATSWKQMGLRLRSSAINGSNKEADFYIVRPTDVTMENGSFHLSIPLSEIKTANIDWADVKELNVFCDVADQYRKDTSNAACDAVTVTFADAKIASTGTVVEPDKAALNKAIADAETKLADSNRYTPDSLAALNTALTQAKAAQSSSDQAAINAAAKALNDAIAALRSYCLGDVDGDGTVAAADALIALQAANGAITLTADQALAANVDGQAGVSVIDALMILHAAAGKITLG